MKGVQRVTIEMGARDPGGAADARNKEHLVHIHLQFVDGSQDEAHQDAVTASGAERRRLHSRPDILFQRPGHLLILPDVLLSIPLSPSRMRSGGMTSPLV